jgi:CRP-like cAMP-binding protein
MRRPARHASLLDLDPDLGADLDDGRREAARRHLAVRLARVEKGEWRPEADAFGAQGGVGLFVVDGFAVRRVQLAHRAAAELLGPGEILRPWQDDGEHAHYPFAATFQILRPLTLAVLDRSFRVRVGAVPEVVGALFARVTERARLLAGNLVVAQLPSVEDRVLVVLWHLADRFGRVRRDGVLLPVNLSHEIIGTIVGARRPSVTSAVGRLTARGLVARDPAGWLLLGDPPREIRALHGGGVVADGVAMPASAATG